MQIQILFGGAMVGLAGCDSRILEVPNPATVADAVQALATDSAVAGELSRCTYSINDTIVGASYQVNEGDELSVDLPITSSS